jgi:hypothetical protein
MEIKNNAEDEMMADFDVMEIFIWLYSPFFASTKLKLLNEFCTSHKI